MKFFQYVPVKPDTNYPIYTITKRGTIELKTEIIPFELLTESEMKKTVWQNPYFNLADARKMFLPVNVKKTETYNFFGARFSNITGTYKGKCSINLCYHYDGHYSIKYDHSCPKWEYPDLSLLGVE